MNTFPGISVMEWMSTYDRRVGIAFQSSDLQSPTNLEVFQDILDFLIALNPLFFCLLGDI